MPALQEIRVERLGLEILRTRKAWALRVQAKDGTEFRLVMSIPLLHHLRRHLHRLAAKIVVVAPASRTRH